MFHYQNSALGPNLLAATSEEEEERYRGRTKLFREMSNETVQRKRNDCMAGKRTWANTVSREEEQETQRGTQEQLRKTTIPKRPNVIMQFSSDEDEEPEERQEQTETAKKEISADLPARKEASLNHPIAEAQQTLIQIPKRSNLLLSFSDDEENSQEDNEAVAASQPTPLINDKNKLILDFESQEDQPSPNQLPITKPNKNVLNALIQRSKDKFFLQPIDEDATLQCLIKRQRKGDEVAYHIHDSATLRIIMSVIKSQDGYLLISKYNELTSCTPSNKTDSVVGKLISNFFGTEFNCYLWTYPFKKFTEYVVDPDKSRQVITIEYQTNIFGLKGPRKMSAFIPNEIDGVVSKKRLNEIYQQEKKKKLEGTVWKFKNKTPKWNPCIEAYVLNFHGRATVSSIKNFIMVSEDENNDAEPRLLFGKFGKDLFNLDVGHPFSLIQGVALALSSFDKKLACQ